MKAYLIERKAFLFLGLRFYYLRFAQPWPYRRESRKGNKLRNTESKDKVSGRSPNQRSDRLSLLSFVFLLIYYPYDSPWLERRSCKIKEIEI